MWHTRDGRLYSSIATCLRPVMIAQRPADAAAPRASVAEKTAVLFEHACSCLQTGNFSGLAEGNIRTEQPLPALPGRPCRLKSPRLLSSGIFQTRRITILKQGHGRNERRIIKEGSYVFTEGLPVSAAAGRHIIKGRSNRCGTFGNALWSESQSDNYPGSLPNASQQYRSGH